MQRPDSCRIAPHVYEIEWLPARKLRQLLGDCNFDRLKIRVRGGLKRSKAQETLLHEILHSCLPSQASENDEFVANEKFVEAMAPVLLQVLKDNPDIVEYLIHQ